MHRVPLTACRSPLTAHRSPLTAHRSPSARRSPFTARRSDVAHRSPLTARRVASLLDRPHPPASSTFFSQVHSALFCLGSTRSPAITTRRGSDDERSRGGGYLPIYVVDRPLRVAAGEVGGGIRFVLNYPSSSRASHRAGGFRDINTCLGVVSCVSQVYG